MQALWTKSTVTEIGFHATPDSFSPPVLGFLHRFQDLRPSVVRKWASEEKRPRSGSTTTTAFGRFFLPFPRSLRMNRTLGGQRRSWRIPFLLIFGI